MPAIDSPATQRRRDSPCRGSSAPPPARRPSAAPPARPSPPERPAGRSAAGRAPAGPGTGPGATATAPRPHRCSAAPPAAPAAAPRGRGDRGGRQQADAAPNGTAGHVHGPAAGRSLSTHRGSGPTIPPSRFLPSRLRVPGDFARASRTSALARPNGDRRRGGQRATPRLRSATRCVEPRRVNRGHDGAFGRWSRVRDRSDLPSWTNARTFTLRFGLYVEGKGSSRRARRSPWNQRAIPTASSALARFQHERQA